MASAMHLYQNQGFEESIQHDDNDDIEPPQNNYEVIDQPPEPTYTQLTKGDPTERDEDGREISGVPSYANVGPNGEPTEPTIARTSFTLSVRCWVIIVIIVLLIGVAVTNSIMYFVIRKGKSISSIYKNMINRGVLYYDQ